MFKPRLTEYPNSEANLSKKISHLLLDFSDTCCPKCLDYCDFEGKRHDGGSVWTSSMDPCSSCKCTVRNKRAMQVLIHRNLANSVVQKFSLFLTMKRRCFQDSMQCNVALLSCFTASNKKIKDTSLR